MKKYLTIGEAAKLLDTTTFNLRYYEKEGLIKPGHTPDSGYRLYDYEDIYALSDIIALRNSDISIKDIRNLSENYSKESCTEMMNRSHEKIKKEIKRLEKLQREIEKTLDIMGLDIDHKLFTVEKFSERKFIIIKSSDYKMDYSIKELYDIYTENNIEVSQLYKSDQYYILNNESIHFCMEGSSKEYNLDSEVYPKGKYLKYSFFATDDETENKIGDFFDYIIKNNMEYQGELLLKRRGKTLMINKSGYTSELQIKIK